MNSMHVRSIEPVRISISESAIAFAEQTSDAQAAWLIHLASSIDGWDDDQSWPMQCRHIAEEMTLMQRLHVVTKLEVLIDHLREDLIIPEHIS